MTTETIERLEAAVDTGDGETLPQYAARMALRASWIAGITIYGAAVAFTWLALFVGAVEQAAHELEPPPA